MSLGTINALILYANIIHVNATIFFPQDEQFAIMKILQTFIAWLNLDLGIEACFYKSMTPYGYNWLQFVFPVYIWVLVLIMIYTSRYSVTVSKIIGHNAVSVLATLFLLSYTKLLRSVIAAVSSISLKDEDGKSHLLWRMDANVSYFSVPHAVLFFAALLAVLLYILPFTLLTLLGPCLQARTNHQMMRWVVRIKPLLDTYQGPFKDKHRYWTGITLLLRIILFTVFAANVRSNPNINLFAIVVSVVVLFIVQFSIGRLYKHWMNGLLDGFYYCNLIIFSSAVLFLNTSQGNTEALACVMAGSAFIVFCLIVLWHFNNLTGVINRVVQRMKQLLSNLRTQSTATRPPPPLPLPKPTISVIDMRELRESILTDTS